jgi:hypothetical protein
MANYKKAFFLALEEEIMANVLAFKKGLDSVKKFEDPVKKRRR